MTDAERDALWICQVCKTRHVIPDFARSCCNDGYRVSRG